MRKLLLGMLFLTATSAALPAHAAVVQYQLVPLGGSSYRYVYTVANDGSLGAGVAIELFDVMFDPSLYDEASLTVTTPAVLTNNWDQIFLASAPSVPAAFDALALTGGIANGNSVSGFAVDFTWIGTGTPGSQTFAIYDPTSYALLEQGVTINPVPLPGALWLFVSGLTALFGTVGRRKGPTRVVR